MGIVVTESSIPAALALSNSGVDCGSAKITNSKGVKEP